jgi:hypothetical protein
MYADTLNLVTTGVGNLIDNGPNNNPGGNSPSIVRARLNNVISPAAMAPALALPWRFRGDGWTPKNPVARQLASQQDIIQAWALVKGQNQVVPDFSQLGGGKYAPLTNLTLDNDAMDSLYQRTFNSFAATLQKRYPSFSEWPADAQMAAMSMAWAMGPSFNFPAFTVAVNAGDFAKAAVESYFKGGGGTPSARTGRNKDNFLMFNNADVVAKGGGDLDLLIFPQSSGSVTTPKSLVASLNSTTAKIETGIAVAAFSGAVYGAYRWWKGTR